MAHFSFDVHATDVVSVRIGGRLLVVDVMRNACVCVGDERERHHVLHDDEKERLVLVELNVRRLAYDLVHWPRLVLGPIADELEAAQHDRHRPDEHQYEIALTHAELGSERIQDDVIAVEADRH